MYASCYILTKIQNLPETPSMTSRTRDGSVDLEKLEI